MNCPRCGNEIPDGKLYCEHCGEEIQIVPEFEPEIEYSMEESLSGIVQEDEIKEKDKEAPKKKNKLLLGIFTALAALLIVLCVVLGIGYYHFHSFAYQIKQAEECIKNGDSVEACKYYERALEIEPENIALKIALADAYKKNGNEHDFLARLYEVFASEKCTDEELINVYKKLITYFVEKEDYHALNELLLSCPDESIRNTYQSYMAKPPVFSYPGGNYAEMLALKLTSSTQGTIYYTMDGMMPDESSEVYTTPIFLDTGNYTITAIFVNEYGIKSEPVSENFDIDVIKPTAPEVSTISGEYFSPTMIEVVEPSEGVVYYTVDGTQPTIQSFVYENPIPMPLGESTFHFIVITEDGTMSECSSLHYNLQLDTLITPEDGTNILVKTLIEIGKLRDEMGTPESGEEGRYLYFYQYAIKIKGNDYYLIHEVFEDMNGMQNKTGIVYAVDLYNGNCFKMSKGALEEDILEPLK